MWESMQQSLNRRFSVLFNYFFYVGTVQFGRDLESGHSKIDGVLKISPC